MTDYQQIYFIKFWCFSYGIEFFGELCSVYFLVDGKIPSRCIADIFVNWICAEPEFRFSWMKLCSSDNNNTTAPYVFICVADICITLISQTPCAFASSVIWPNMYPWHDCSILWGFSYPCFWLRNSMHCIWCIYVHVFSQET